MKVIELDGFGGPEVLRLGERPEPVAGPGEVLIRVAAAGVNGPDKLQRMGLYPPPPGASDLLGLEVSGTVEAIGEGALERAFWPIEKGNKVCALTNGGGYGAAIAVPAGQILPVPQGVDVIDAAGLPETYFTVWSNFFLNRDVQAGSIFLVHGGSGGIGSTAVQLGKAFGQRVFATAGSDESCRYVESLGAEKAIRYDVEDFVKIVRDAGGANVILDMRGGDYVARNIAAAAPDGRIVQLAFNSGSKVEVDLMPVMLKRLQLTGSTLRPRDPAFKSAIAQDLHKRAWPLFASGRLKPTTFEKIPFEDAARAHSLMDNGGLRGKLILTL